MTDLEAVAAELLALGTATLYEASGYEASGFDVVLPPSIRPTWPGARLVGRALPVRAAAGDNLALHRALEAADPGDVLVVDAAGAPHGYWGEGLTVAAQTRGVRGLVIDGGVRDVDRLEALGFATFSSLIALRGTTKNDLGTIGDPIHLGGVTVRRGDVVVADGDGIIALPADQLDRVLAAARQRAAIEAAYLDRLRAGELTLDIYGFRKDADT